MRGWTQLLAQKILEVILLQDPILVLVKSLEIDEVLELGQTHPYRARRLAHYTRGHACWSGIVLLIDIRLK